MRVGLFIPCYIDQFYPQVGIASLQLLEKLGLRVEYPLKQTCCGQPLANAGFEHLGIKLIDITGNKKTYPHIKALGVRE